MLRAFVIGFVIGLALVTGVVAIVSATLAREPSSAAFGPPEVVRVLDVTIKDSNTTGHRQRFVCRPAK